MAELVGLENVSKAYGPTAQTLAVDGVTLTLHRQEVAALIGDSGSGKSTLLNMIGLLDRPTGGEVRLEGRATQDMTKVRRAQLRNSFVGFVFQYHYLLPEFSVLENVLMPARIGARPQDSARRRALELLALLNLESLADKNADQLSGGEKQRAAIGRALINEPPLVLADEPTGNLDSANSDDVYRLFRSINEQMGTTFLVVTHNRAVSAQMDRVLEIADGRLIRDDLAA